MLIALLIKVHVIPMDLGEQDELLQNFLVVVEMFLFAVAHYFVFSHKPYVDPAAAEVPCIAACLRMLDVRDVAGDVKEHFVDPIPRPKLRQMMKRGVAGSSSNPVSDEDRRCEVVNTENSPLLKKKAGVHLHPSMETEQEVPGKGSPSSSTATGQQKLSDLSYDILSYKEFDNRGNYGSRSGVVSRSVGSSDELKHEQDTEQSSSNISTEQNSSNKSTNS